MEITLVKQFDNTFKLAYESDYELAKKIKPNEFVKCTITKPRNLKFHKKFFVLLDLVFQNQERFKHKEDLREELIIEAGFFDEYTTFQGEVKRKAKSISFAKMDEYEFNELYNSVLDQIVIHFNFGKEDMIEHLEKYFTPSRNFNRE